MTIPKTIHIEDYQPLPYKIDTIHLTVDLHPDATRVLNCMEIRPAEAWNNSPLILDGENVELLSVESDGKPMPHDIVDGKLHIAPFNTEKSIQITTLISPIKNTELDGLYFVKNTFCTQNEPEGFRKITYFYDRPDNMSRFTTTLIGDKTSAPFLLANGNPTHAATIGGNRHSVTWVDPFPKPSYLFALVAGDFDMIEDSFTTLSGRHVLLQIYSDKGTANRCRYAMSALKKAMKWDEDVYGREYDLDRFMIVAIDSFNMGAMENKGLNVFNSAYILADPSTATDQDYMNIEGVVAHEYFHNWTGNRITCRDWFQLTLKEGLTVYRDQEFSSDMNSRGVKRINDVRLLKEAQFTEDAGPMAHPIQPKTYIEINNFYTSTVYNKGAEIIRMMALIAGKSGYRRGTDLYFERFDGHAVTTDDFVRSIEDGAEINLTQFRNWYHQAGTPHVTVTPGVTHDRLTSLTFEQTCRDTPETAEKQPYVIPIAAGFYNRDGAPVPVLIDDGPETFNPIIILSTRVKTVTITANTPNITPSLFQNLSAPVTYDYPYSDDDLARLLASDRDPVNRFNAAQKLFETALIGPELSALPDTLYSAIQTLISDTTIDPAVAAACLQFPTTNRLLDIVPGFEIERITRNVNELSKRISTAFYTQIIDRYHTLSTDSPYHPSAEQIGNRRLRNTLLLFIAESDTEIPCHQFKTAQNMTDQLAALTALLHHTDTPQPANDALNTFFETWKNEPLVINKWLSVQAGSRRPSTPSTVNKLLTHPAFDRLIPNQFRALVGTFSSNQQFFHNKTGAGYQWVGQQIKELDPDNPQIAARIGLAFQRAARCDLDRRKKIDAVLADILSVKTISNNLFEVVSKIKDSYNLTQ